ncbi:MAG: saccharopine dehydrogenase [Caulobacter sp.]|nr:saccharopine dehydrogenase [Caulobacter sp.]
MNRQSEFDIIVYGATGFTGRLVAEYLAGRHGVGGEVKWAMAGRSADKLAAVRDEIGAPPNTPLIVADASDPASLKAMVGRARAILTTVGPYQLYGSDLVAACAAAGADYLDLSGEPTWMAQMIAAHEAAAKASGARILFSCGFDSIPFELGVLWTQEIARKRLGHAVSRIKGRVRAMQGGLSGGTAASGAATMAAMQKDPSLAGLMFDPFALTPGFRGPAQPDGMTPHRDEDLGEEVGPFMMATINSKNIHRSNLLQGHAYGADFVYDEMAVITPAAPTEFTSLGGEGMPKPGEGPSKAQRDAGFYDLLFIGLDSDGRQVRGSVHGDRDPGYGSTSKIIAETAICLVKQATDLPGGVWVPGAALGRKLIDRLQANAGLTFRDETA